MCGLLKADLVPTYSVQFQDAITGDNSFNHNGSRYYTIDAGADSYQNDYYERPTVATYQLQGTSFATNEYYSNLDIDTARFGYDANYLYIAIDMLGLSKHTSDGVNTLEGLKYEYGFRIGTNPLDPTSKGGFLFVVDDPSSIGSTFTGLKTTGYQDVNRDVGGTGISVTKQDLGSEVNGNGYELKIISDGRANDGSLVLMSRINSGDSSIVEFALAYARLGLDPSAITYLDFQAIKGGPKDPQNYLWNDQYNKSEAGSPYGATSGDLSKSEFGTQGLGNIYELDTLRAGSLTSVPEPATWAFLIPVIFLLAARMRIIRKPS